MAAGQSGELWYGLVRKLGNGYGLLPWLVVSAFRFIYWFGHKLLVAIHQNINKFHK